ncbi:MAG: hypothetical protein ACI4LE_07030 [Faecalibacterium sp.]
MSREIHKNQKRLCKKPENVGRILAEIAEFSGKAGLGHVKALILMQESDIMFVESVVRPDRAAEEKRKQGSWNKN